MQPPTIVRLLGDGAAILQFVLRASPKWTVAFYKPDFGRFCCENLGIRFIPCHCFQEMEKKTKFHRMF